MSDGVTKLAVFIQAVTQKVMQHACPHLLEFGDHGFGLSNLYVYHAHQGACGSLILWSGKM